MRNPLLFVFLKILPPLLDLKVGVFNYTTTVRFLKKRAEISAPSLISKELKNVEKGEAIILFTEV